MIGRPSSATVKDRQKDLRASQKRSYHLDNAVDASNQQVRLSSEPVLPAKPKDLKRPTPEAAGHDAPTSKRDWPTAPHESRMIPNQPRKNHSPPHTCGPKASQLSEQKSSDLTFAARGSPTQPHSKHMSSDSQLAQPYGSTKQGKDKLLEQEAVSDHRSDRWGKTWKQVPQLSATVMNADQLRREINALWGHATDIEEKSKSVMTIQKKSLEAYKLRQKTAEENAASSEGEPPPALEPFEDHFHLMFGLHRNLVQDYYDLFRATAFADTRDDASKDLKEFCHTHHVVNRLWRYGMQNLLDFWRQRLPESKEYMHAYIIICYQMLTLLLENSERFKGSWLECLGDLSRYRMAIEQDNTAERTLWLEVAELWYVKAWNLQPGIGRPLHHQAILARRESSWRALGLYARALSAIEPFVETRNSMKGTHMDPMMAQQPAADDLNLFVTVAFLRTLAPDFGTYGDNLPTQPTWTATADRFCDNLELFIASSRGDYDFVGECVVTANLAALLGWGDVGPQSTNLYRRAFDASRTGANMSLTPADLLEFKRRIFRPQYFFFRVLNLHLSTDFEGEELVLRHNHIAFVFMAMAFATPAGRALIFGDETVPWNAIATFLNSWQQKKQINNNSDSLMASNNFPHSGPSSPPKYSHVAIDPKNVDNRTSESVIRRTLASIDPVPSNDPGLKQHFPEDDDTPLADPTRPSSPVDFTSQPNTRVLPEDRTMHGQIWSVGYLPNGFLDGSGPPEEEAATLDIRRESFTQLRVERLLWLGWRMAKIGRAMRQHGKGRGKWIEINDATGEFSVCDLKV